MTKSKKKSRMIWVVGIIVVLLFFAGEKKEGVIPGYSCVSESDGGYEIYIAGSVDYTDSSGNPGTLYDQCQFSTGILKELECYQGNVYLHNVPCDYGCESGACLEQSSSDYICVDEDGGDRPFIFGNVFIYDPDYQSPGEHLFQTFDVCTGDTLHEMVCVSSGGTWPGGYGLIDEVEFNCQSIGKVCQNGECADDYTSCTYHPHPDDECELGTIGCEGDMRWECSLPNPSYDDSCYVKTIRETCPLGCTEGVCNGNIISLSGIDVPMDVTLGDTTQIDVTVTTELNYNDVVLEAYIAPVGTPFYMLATVPIGVNRCDILAGIAENPLWRNELVDLSTSDPTDAEFTFTPPDDGWYDVYVTLTTDCGVYPPDIFPNDGSIGTPIGSFLVQEDCAGAECPAPEEVPCGDSIQPNPGCTGPCQGTGMQCQEGHVCESGTCVDYSSQPLYLMNYSVGSEITIGDTKTVEAIFMANQDFENIILEAQITSVTTPSMQTLHEIIFNRCDILAGVAESPLFRNEMINISQGEEVTARFTFTPPATGWFDVNVDALTACGGEVDILNNTLIGSFEVKPEQGDYTDAICSTSSDCIDKGKCEANDDGTKCVSICDWIEKWDKDEQECVFNMMYIMYFIGALFLLRMMKQMR